MRLLPHLAGLILALGLSTTVHAADNAPTLAVRISGLVCDLCIHGIEKDLKSLSHVKTVAVVPKEGIVAIGTDGASSGALDQGQIKTILVNAGYSVHQFTSTSVLVSEVQKSPKQAATRIWSGGASEQRKVLASAPVNTNVCAARAAAQTFDSYKSSSWGK